MGPHTELPTVPRQSTEIGAKERTSILLARIVALLDENTRGSLESNREGRNAGSEAVGIEG